MKKRTHLKSYRSGFEESFQKRLVSWNVPAEYETEKVKYVIPESKHTYTPDFKIGINKYIETKGIFSAQDRKKHLLIRDQHPEIDIMIVFYRAHSVLRKGSKTTYADWCDKNKIKWADSSDEIKIKAFINADKEHNDGT